MTDKTRIALVSRLKRVGASPLERDAAKKIVVLEILVEALSDRLAEADAWIAAQGPSAAHHLNGPAEAIEFYRDALRRHTARQEHSNAKS